MKWHKLISRGSHPLLFIDLVRIGITKHFASAFEIDENIKYYKRIEGETFISHNQFKSILKKIRKKACLDPLYMHRIANKCSKSYELVRDFAYNANRKEIESTFPILIKKYTYAMSMIYMAWFVEPIFEKIIPNTIKRLLNITTYADTEKLDLLKTHGKTTRIEKHARKYAWFRTYVFQVKPYTEKEIIKRYKEFKNPISELNIMNTKIREYKKKFANSVKNIDNKLLNVIFDARKHIETRDHRMRLLSETHYRLYDYFINYANYLGLSYNQFINCTLKEINNLSALKRNLNLRINEYGIYVNGKTKIYTGSALQKIKLPLKVKQKIIKGTIACKGKAKGRVRIITDIYKVQDIAKGDIIIATMTTPDFMHIIEKASAIVTDEGGITCHAALIARELNKPSIIGTKYATKIFKDGDLVEVNAREGYIRKL